MTPGTALQMSYLPRCDPEPAPTRSMLSDRTTALIIPPSLPSAAQKKLRAARAREQGTRGPGYYGDLAGVAFSDRRIHTAIDHPGARFTASNTEQLATPGPGRYRCETAPEYGSFSRKGIMDTVGRDGVRSVRAVAGDSGIAPGAYTLSDTLLRTTQGTRGPYDCYSGPRIVGTPRAASGDLGPAQYPPAPLSSTPGTLDIGKAAPRFRSNASGADLPFYDR